MSLHRKCNTVTILVCLGMLIILGYSYLSLQESYQHMREKEHEIVKRRDHENVLREQLKVVYHHTTRVEEELTKERERHKNTRNELLEKKKEFYANLTKTKHEAWTRFNALDSDHKMLKAEHDEMKTNYLGLQAQYRRLSTDHRKISKEAKQNYEELKNSHESESISLQDRIQELYKKNTYYRQLSDQNEDYYKKVQEYLNKCTKLTKEYKDDLLKYREQMRQMSDVEKRHEIEPTKKQDVSVLDQQFAQLQEDNQNLTDQKHIDKSKLQDSTGVKNLAIDKNEDKAKEKDDDFVKYEKDSSLEKSDKTVNIDTDNKDDKETDIQKNLKKDNAKDFMREQRNRFLRRRKENNNDVTESSVIRNDRYRGSVKTAKTTSKNHLFPHENSRYKNIGDSKEAKNERAAQNDKYKTTEGRGRDRLEKERLATQKKEEVQNLKTNDENEVPPEFRGSDEHDTKNEEAKPERVEPAQEVRNQETKPLEAVKEPAKNNQLQPPGGMKEEGLSPNLANGDHLKQPANGNQLKPPAKQAISEGDDIDRKFSEADDKHIKNNVPLVKPVRSAALDKSVDVNRNERMDVKKVTLEDDENGDQNLDKSNNEEEKEQQTEDNDEKDGKNHAEADIGEEGIQQEKEM